MSNTQPIEVKLEANRTYYWCRCGKTQPFCDGSHQGTGMEPLAFTAEETKSAWLCTCKKTATAPFCGGSHNK